METLSIRSFKYYLIMNTIIFVTLILVLVVVYLAFSVINDRITSMYEHLISIEEHITEDVDEYETIIQQLHDEFGKMIQATSVLSDSEVKNLEKRFNDKAKKQSEQVKRIIETYEKSDISLLDAVFQEVNKEKEKQLKKQTKKQSKK